VVRRCLLLALAAVVAACSSGGAGEQTVTVLAASSLTAAFTEIAAAFEAEHEGVDVDLSFDGSARLATAIVEGAPVDVFASADQANMGRVVDEGLVERQPAVFATNRLQVVVAEGNPLGVGSLADLAGLRLSLCQRSVPCGAYAAEAFDRAGLATPPAGDQESAKGVLTQVQLGEADAGLVYVTDVLAADDVEGVDLAAGQQVEAVYVAAALDGDSDSDASAFVDFVRGDQAKRILSSFGFGVP
jgi:molybdate transport system substrate-binding protein